MVLDYRISILRICAMLSIIICHIGTYYNNVLIGQFFNFGVQLFALISGYLYGSREFCGSYKWLIKRYIRLFCPLLAWVICFTLFDFINKQECLTWYQYLLLLFNLQGIEFIYTSIPNITRGPWFFTPIMLCYIVLWIYTSLRRQHYKSQTLSSLERLIILILFLVLAYVKININLVIAFLIGYNLAYKKFFGNKRIVLLLGSIIQFLLCIAIRLLSRQFIDGTILYDMIIVPITHIGISIVALSIVQWLHKTTNIICNVGQNKFFHHIDKISIYVYICHSWFIDMIFKIDMNFICKYLLFLIVVFSTATLIFLVFGKLERAMIDYIDEKFKSRAI